MVPVPALLVAAVVLSGTIKEERRALSAIDQVKTAHQRLEEVSALLRTPSTPQQDYRTLTQLTRDLGPLDPDRRRQIETTIQKKIESLAALSAIDTPEDTLLDKNRQATEGLQASVSALTLEYDHLLSSESGYARAIRRKEFAVCFQGAFIFLLGEFLAATVFLAAITEQIHALKANSRRLAQGLPLEPLFTDNWELNQIGHDLIQASVALHQREQDLEQNQDQVPDSSAAGRQLANEHTESMVAVLRVRNQELAEALSSAREALASKGRFLADLSRELRIPLTSILGFSELLYDGNLGAVNEQQKGCLRDILAGSEKMLQLTDSVVGAVSSESPPASIPASTVNLERLVKDVKYLLEPASRKKGVRVEIEIDAGLREVDGNPEKLKQLLHQHISDAIQFTPHDAVLELRLRPEGESALRLEVHIRGLGLASKDVVRLFPEFHVDSVSVKIRAGQQQVAAAEDDNVFYAILPGIARPAESTVRARSSRARAAAKDSSLVH